MISGPLLPSGNVMSVEGLQLTSSCDRVEKTCRTVFFGREPAPRVMKVTPVIFLFGMITTGVKGEWTVQIYALLHN
jgi:hypothetical protein